MVRGRSRAFLPFLWCTRNEGRELKEGRAILQMPLQVPDKAVAKAEQLHLVWPCAVQLHAPSRTNVPNGKERSPIKGGHDTTTVKNLSFEHHTGCQSLGPKNNCALLVDASVQRQAIRRDRWLYTLAEVTQLANQDRRTGPSLTAKDSDGSARPARST